MTSHLANTATETMKLFGSAFYKYAQKYLDILLNIKLNIHQSAQVPQFPTKREFLKYFIPSDLGNKSDADLDEYLNINPHIIAGVQDQLYSRKVPAEVLLAYPDIYKYQLEFSEFISIQIHHYISRHIKKSYRIEYEHESQGLKGHLTINTEADGISEAEIREVVGRILLLNRILKTRRLPVFRIYKCKLNKELPNASSKLFTPNNVNTAATDGTTIIIWRSEELLKSIFHECIHFHNLDFRGNVESALHSENYSVDNKNGQILFFEATTELLANLFNQIILSASRSWPDFHRKMKTTLLGELEFSFAQQCKILRYVGFRQWRDFYQISTTGNRTLPKKRQLVESTSVLAYYILKFQLMWNLSQSLDIIGFNQNLTIDAKIAIQLATLLAETACDPTYISAIDKCLKTRNMNKKTKTARARSMRMTIAYS